VQGVALNDIDAFDSFGFILVVIQQPGGKSQDSAHRRADFMAHVGQELALGPAGGLGGFLGLGQLLLDVLALGDVADVALNDAPPAFPVDVADKLYGDLAAVFVFQWKIFIADSANLLQRLHRALGALSILEDADLPQLLSHKVVAGIAKQINHEAIDVQHFGGSGIEDKDAVVRRLKQAPVADF